MSIDQQPLRQYVKDHLPLYIFIFVLFGTGIVFGAVMVGALTLDQKQDLARHMSGFFQMITDGKSLDASGSFQQSLGLNLKWILLIWVLGLSVVGLPLIFALDFLKGVLVGFAVGAMIGQYSWHGALFALVSVVPQNLVLIPAIVIVSAAAASFSVHLIRNRFVQKGKGLYPVFMGYSGPTLGVGILLVGVSLYEAFLSPTVMNWVAPSLLGN